MKNMFSVVLLFVSVAVAAMDVNAAGILQAAGPWEMEQASNPVQF